MNDKEARGCCTHRKCSRLLPYCNSNCRHWKVTQHHRTSRPPVDIVDWEGRVERRCWVNFQCQGVLLVWMIVGQGPIALAVGAGGGCLDIFSLVYLFSFLSPSLWETARYRLKYCLKGPLNPKQSINQSTLSIDYARSLTCQSRFHVAVSVYFETL